MKNAVILCSGGVDSVVTAHYVKKRLDYKGLIILFFDYSQKTLKSEEKFSRICAKELQAEFIKITVKELGSISGSLINKSEKFKGIERKALKNTKKESEKWYVPCRNLVFLSYALALCDSLFVKKKKNYDIFIGFKNEGNESYPDSTKEFVGQVDSIAKKSCSGKFRVIAPLIKKDKEEIIQLGKRLDVELKNTFSCYTSKKTGKHCGKCLACMLRKEGFYWANIDDPSSYIDN